MSNASQRESHKYLNKKLKDDMIDSQTVLSYSRTDIDFREWLYKYL